MSRPEDLCRDIKTPFKLKLCRNIDSPCCNQVSSAIKHPLSRPSFLEVNVGTDECFVATDILNSVQHYVSTQTILFLAY